MKTKLEVRTKSMKVKTTPPAGWRDARQRMTAMMFAPVAAMLGMLRPGDRMPRSAPDASKGSK